MFRVHLPARSYFKKQIKTYGSAELLSLLNPLITKSGYLHFVGDGGNGRPHNWNPVVDENNVSTDPDVHDHPPWNHHPETGELLEGGLHPIDFAQRYLMRKLGMDEKQAAGVLQSAIERYNTKHPEGSNHTLPDFHSPQWRKVFAGPYYDHKDEAPLRQVRGAEPLYDGGPRPLLTYAMNNANVNTTGASTGRWIDAGFLHMNNEIGEELVEQGYPPQDIKKLKVVQYNRLLPRDLSGGIVQAWTGQQVDEANRSGSVPEQLQSSEQQQDLSDQRAHPEIYAHQVVKLLPDAFYDVPTSGLGGRSGNVPEYLLDRMKEAGIPLDAFSPEDLAKIGNTRAMKLLFQETAKLDSLSGRGAVKDLAHATFRDMGSHTDFKDETLNDHISHAAGAADSGDLPFHGRANRAASHFIAHITHVAGKLVEEGMGEDEAKAEAVRRMRESEATAGNRWASEEGVREKTEQLVDAMLGQSGHEGFSLDSINLPTGRAATGLPEMGAHHDVPEEWHKRVIMGSHLMAPIGNTTRPDQPLNEQPVGEEAPVAPAPVAPAPVAAPVAPLQGQRQLTDFSGAPTPSAPVPPMAAAYPTRQASPLEQQYHQMLGTDPAQRTFDIGSSALVQRSNDVASSIDDIKKKIEMVQIIDAQQDPMIKKMLPNKSVSIESFWDVQIVAKSLGLTSIDIHALYQSEGDWHKIAEQWSVQPEVVKAVKVAFGGN